MPKRAIDKVADAVGRVADSSGKRSRWRVDKGVPGVICATACEQIVVHGLTWPAVALAFVGVLPLLRGDE